jgi:hypothetical protein
MAPEPSKPKPPENAATLLMTLGHHFSSGTITVRVDGVEMARDPLHAAAEKSKWSRSLRVPAGRRRVEVRVVGDGSVDDLEGIDLPLKPRERRSLALSISPLTHRLKLRIADPGPETKK